MNLKRVVLRELARQDIDEAVGHYLSQAGDRAALGFIGALEQAFRHLARHPKTGSPGCAHELDLPGLRSWLLKRYPYLIFFVERDDHLDVWRVLHAQRDVAAWLHDPDDARATPPAAPAF